MVIPLVLHFAYYKLQDHLSQFFSEGACDGQVERKQCKSCEACGWVIRTQRHSRGVFFWLVVNVREEGRYPALPR